MTHCSFCGKAQVLVRGLVASPHFTVCICNECLDVCRKILEDDRKHPAKTGTYRLSGEPLKEIACLFCRRPQEVVDKLISAPAGHGPCYICDRCVGQGISELKAKERWQKDPLLKRLIRAFKDKPGNFSITTELPPNMQRR
ncbi:MAG TPA: ClpX C4-type zinc finger protein [Terriglobales bacterium]|nr:ClpX C4-type zinc finger protein [Terriglobales bacterium]